MYYGPWAFLQSGNGLTIQYNGITICSPGELQLFAPGYSQGYFTSNSVAPKITRSTLPEGGVEFVLTYTYQSQARSMVATENVIAQPDNSLQFQMSLSWNDTHDVLVEWNPMLLRIPPLIGSGCTLITPKGPQNVQIPYLQPSTNGMETLSDGASACQFINTAIGDISLNADPYPIYVGDARSDIYIHQSALWLGLLGTTVHPNQALDWTLFIVITPRKQQGHQSIHPSFTVDSSHLVATQFAQVPLAPLVNAVGEPVILPTPKHVAWDKGQLTLPEYTHIALKIPFFNKNFSGIHHAFSGLCKTLTQCHVHYVRDSCKNSQIVLAVLHPNSSDETDLPEPPNHAEGYTLQVKDGKAIVVGHDGAGLQWGIETLQQLIHYSEAKGVELPDVTVNDWPSMQFRGAHLFTSRYALPFHMQLMNRVLTPLKMNRLVMECEYTDWPSHPELDMPFSDHDETLHAEVEYAQLLGLEPIPLIETLGHAHWLFASGHHLHLAEDPLHPYEYDASNPEVYSLIDSIFSDAIKIFNHPSWFHIGHDEVYMPSFIVGGTYPSRPVNVKRGLPAVFDDDVISLHNWLALRGAKTMMWGDMLLYRKEGTSSDHNPYMEAANAPSLAAARQLRAGLPRDIRVCDWRYGNKSARRNGLTIFEKDGFSTIGSSWYHPENIRSWSRLILLAHAKGLLQTTWAGYQSGFSQLETDFRQFSAFTLAAEYAWSGTNLYPQSTQGEPQDQQLPFASRSLFRRYYFHSIPSGTTAPGWFVDLSRVVNVCLNNAETPLAALSTAEPETEAEVSDDTGIRNIVPHDGVVFNSELPIPGIENRPEKLSIAIGKRVSCLGIQQALYYALPPDTPAIRITIEYADGERAAEILRYGHQTSALSDSEPGDSASTERLAVGNGLTARLYVWRNPMPAEPVRELVVEPLSKQAAPILFGVTVVGAA